MALNERVAGPAVNAPSRVFFWLVFAGLTSAYYLANPYWFGDAIWYAKDLAKGWSAIPSDAGHMIWRPLGYGIWKGLSALGIHVDPLVALRLLSAAGTALLLLATYRLALGITSERRTALLAAALVGVSKVCLAYGGSGSSYTAAMAASVYSFAPIMVPRENEWQSTDAVRSIFALGVAYVTWGMSVLVLPGLFVALLFYSQGGTRRRILRATTCAAASLVFLIALSVITYATSSHTEPGTFLEWLRSSSHGTPPGLSLMGLARAAYGTLVAFVHLGSAGTAAKNLVLGGAASADSVMAVLPAVVGLGFSSALLASFYLVVRGRNAGRRSRQLGMVAAAVFLPVAAFALMWKGSDVERFSLAVPMLAIVLVQGLTEPRMFLPRTRIPLGLASSFSVICLLAAANLGFFVSPALVTRGGITMRVGREARQHLPQASLLIVAGNDLFADVVAASSYFYSIQVHNITYDVQMNGTSGYEDRIARLIRASLSEQGKIAVLSDFLGDRTPGGIGLIEREHPKPTLEDVGRLFVDWRQGARWQVGRFTFVELVPPARELRDGSAP